MGTLERREREKQRRRVEILATARTIFFDKGFRNTTIDDIAKASELARGTIYLYFQTKEEIYATVLEEGMDTLSTLITSSFNPDADPMTNLLAGHDAFFHFHDDFSDYYNVLMLDQMQIEDLLPPALKARLDNKFAAMVQWVAGLLQTGIAEGCFRVMPPLEAALLQMGMTMGFAQMLDKCSGSMNTFVDCAQVRQLMHDAIAMSVAAR